MTKPDHDGAVYTAQLPVRINNDGKTYFIFQLLNEQGVAVDPIFYRDVALKNSADLMATVLKAYVERRTLRVFLEAGSRAMVSAVGLGRAHAFPGPETLYAGKARP